MAGGTVGGDGGGGTGEAGAAAGDGGWQNTAFTNLLAPGNTFWLLGPEAALTLFDGGLRKARVEAKTKTSGG